MYSIDLSSRVAIYEQLYKNILILILSGTLTPNEKLPTVREIAKELNVNPNTVVKSYSFLERDGIIYTLAGRGYFVKEIDKKVIEQYLLKDFTNSVSDALKSGIMPETLITQIQNINKGENL